MSHMRDGRVKVPEPLKRGQKACLFEKLPNPFFLNVTTILLFIFDAYYEKFYGMPYQEFHHYPHHSGEITVLVGNPMIHQQPVMFELHP